MSPPQEKMLPESGACNARACIARAGDQEADASIISNPILPDATGSSSARFPLTFFCVFLSVGSAASDCTSKEPMSDQAAQADSSAVCAISAELPKKLPTQLRSASVLEPDTQRGRRAV